MFRRQSSRGDGGITGLLGHQKTSALLGTLTGFTTTLPPILLLTPHVTTEIITWLVGWFPHFRSSCNLLLRFALMLTNTAICHPCWGSRQWRRMTSLRQQPTNFFVFVLFHPLPFPPPAPPPPPPPSLPPPQTS